MDRTMSKRNGDDAKSRTVPDINHAKMCEWIRDETKPRLNG